MKIFVDADASPVVNLAIKTAKQYALEIIVVKNFAHRIEDSYAKVVSVDISNDSADFYIVNHLDQGDIVITQDYGLAAMVLSKAGYPIHQSGMIYNEDNIDSMLNTRHINQELRKSGKHYAKFKKRTEENDNIFLENFTKLIDSLINPNEKEY